MGRRDHDQPRPEGAVLEDRSITEIAMMGAIEPFDPGLVQPSSIDLRLGRSFRVFDAHKHPYVDLREGPPEDLTRLIELDDDQPFTLHPGEFVLGSTLEWVKVPTDLVARLEGKSSLGRLGLVIHATAGYIDPGFEGNITLEMKVDAPIAIRIYYSCLIAQLSFIRLVREPMVAYNGRYQGDRGAVGSRYGPSSPG